MCPIRVSPEPEQPCVCDLTQLMRVRLMCGLYNRHAVPPRWRRLAQAYCVSVSVAIYIYIYFTYTYWSLSFTLYIIPSIGLYYISLFVSLVTGDEYIYKTFHQNPLTDITLDSRNIFSLLQKRAGQLYYYTIAFLVGSIVANFWKTYDLNVTTVLVYILPLVLDISLVFLSTTKILIMALFDARMLVLKRRFQRYGFRTVGLGKLQPYCQIYKEIWKGLDATDNPPKYLLFLEMICNSTKLMVVFGYYGLNFIWKDVGVLGIAANAVQTASILTKLLVYSFGHIAFLESATVHNEDMAIFTVTQLIKNPSAAERQRMYDFLSVLEQPGAGVQLTL